MKLLADTMVPFQALHPLINILKMVAHKKQTQPKLIVEYY